MIHPEIHRALTLTEPRFLLDLINLILANHTDRPSLRVCLMPKKDDAEMPDDFYSASVFLLADFDKYYVRGGPPIYEVDMKTISSTIKLSLADDWLSRALIECDARVMPAYTCEPFTIAAPESLFEAVDALGQDGHVFLLAPTYHPLEKQGIDFAQHFPASDTVFEALMQSRSLQPLYDVLSIDENRTLTLQLHQSWLSGRKNMSMLMSATT